MIQRNENANHDEEINKCKFKPSLLLMIQPYKKSKSLTLTMKI